MNQQQLLQGCKPGFNAREFPPKILGVQHGIDGLEALRALRMEDFCLML
jgi:hypothetical protein